MNKNMSMNIRRNIITYIHIRVISNITICVYIGNSTNISINMNMFLKFVGTLVIHISIGFTESIRIRKSICNHID